MLHRADAVGRHTLRLHEVLLGRGIASHIYVEMDDPETASETRPFARYAEEARRPETCWSTNSPRPRPSPPGSAPAPKTLVVNYHNVTPPEYYAPWDNGMARHQLLAQTQLRELAPRAALGLAVSAFNEAELREAGFARTAVVPPAAMAPAGRRRHAGAPASLADRRRRPLGQRRAPRARTRRSSSPSWRSSSPARTTMPAATLEVVGRPVVPSYTAALHRFVDELGLREAVTFTGALSDDAPGDRHGRRRRPGGAVAPRGLRRAGARGDDVGPARRGQRRRRAARGGG